MRLTITRARDTAQLYLDTHASVDWRVTRVVPSGFAPDAHIRRLLGRVVCSDDLLAWATGSITSAALATAGTPADEHATPSLALERSA